MSSLLANTVTPVAAGREEAGRPALKVMHVVNRMALGGMEKGVLKVAGQLTDGFEHRVWCIRDCDASLIQDWMRPEQIVALNLAKSRFSLFVPKLARSIREYGPDIVHCRNWGAIEAALAARLAKVPVVIHSEHGYEVNSVSRTPWRQRLMRRLVLSTADAVFTVSRELRDFHAREAGVPAKRIRVLYNGVDTRRFAPDPEARARRRAAFGFSPDDFVVGAVGRMVSIKRYDTLLKAVATLHAKGVACKLLLVGDGPELKHLLELAASLPGLTANLVTPGKCDDVPELLRTMDTFVQSSLSEGMSNTILEAMATGIPVVATRVGGNPEMVEEGESGWLFKPGDVEHLSRLLLKLASHPELRQKSGDAARRRVRDGFSNESMLENYRQLYLELVHKRGADAKRTPAQTSLRPARSEHE